MTKKIIYTIFGFIFGIIAILLRPNKSQNQKEFEKLKKDYETGKADLKKAQVKTKQAKEKLNESNKDFSNKFGNNVNDVLGYVERGKK